MKKQLKLNTWKIIGIVLLFIVALNALAAGYSFIIDPSGKGLGITTDYLKASAPFKNYLIPGIVLFLVNGVLSIAIAIAAIKNYTRYPLLFIMQGCILVGWIGIQLMMVTTFHPFHLIIATIGLLLILMGWLLNRKKKEIIKIR